jgi:hypothetical protein
MTAKDVQKTVVEKGDNVYEIRYEAPKFTNEALATISVTENENGEFILTDISISDSDYIDSVLGISINDGVSTIKESVYAGSELVEVAIAETVTEIKNNAFDCSIETVTLRYGDESKNIGFDAFGNQGPESLDVISSNPEQTTMYLSESMNDTRNFQNTDNITINGASAKVVGQYPNYEVKVQDDAPNIENDKSEISEEEI